MKQSYVYIMASYRNGTLYVEVTSDLIRRVWAHRNKFIKSFTSKYDVNDLVYYEVHLDIEDAIKREKQIKKWNRAWKIDLIETMNPGWKDFFGKIIK